MSVKLPSSKLQASIALDLEKLRKLVLQEALADTVGRLDVRTVNAELDAIVPSADLAQLASRGIRGELLFAVPSILQANPRLLG